MNKKNIGLLLLLLVITTTTSAQSINKLWKQVTQAEKSSLPATAIKLTDKIFQKAQAEKNVPQMLKAYMWRMKYREQITPDSLVAEVKGLQRWASNCNEPIERAVLHSIIAEVYADYAARNRWMLRQRTAIVDEDLSSDMKEWSGNQFVDQVRLNLTKSLQPANLLLKQTAAAYVPFVELGKASATYYDHSLYQLLGTRAIESFRVVANIAQDSLINTEIDALYKELAATNKEANRIDGYVVTMLDYLQWKQESDPTFRSYRAPKGVLGLTQDPYLAGLNTLISEFQSHPICAEVYLARAKYAYAQKEAVIAMQICDETIQRYPRYIRIGALKNLKREIENPSLTVNVQQVVYPDTPVSLQIRHKNLAGFVVSLYKANKPEAGKGYQEELANFNAKQYQKVAEKRLGLIIPQNYQLADTTLTVDMPDAGVYFMQITPEDKRSTKSEVKVVYVTRFKTLTRSLPQKQYEVVALDSKTGHPIADATVTFYTDKNEVAKQLTTDGYGKVMLPWSDQLRQIDVAKGPDIALPLQVRYWGNYSFETPKETVSSVKLLTDRTLYRPGQTVYVKGIAYNQLLDTAQVIPHANYTLTLLDVNQQEVAKQELRTNAFGSFATSFTLPAACLNGRFTLQTQSGSTTIQVESYKRPTFDIVFDKQIQSYSLGDKVELQGEVKTFSGVALQDLPVRYTVTRQHRLGWRMPLQSNTPISSGTVQLNSNGTFAIPVVLQGDKESKLGYYQFQVEATVTTLSGETQSTSYTLSVGNQSLLLSANLPELMRKDEKISAIFQAFNLNGQPVTVQGKVTLYPYTDQSAEGRSNMDNREVGNKAVYEGTFTSNETSELSAWQSLPSGAYQLQLSAHDDQGREVTYKRSVVLFSIKDTRPPTYTSEWFYAVNTSFDASHPAEFYLGTSMSDVYVMADVFSGNEWFERKVLQLSDSIVRFEYPYQERYGNGLTVTFCFVKDQQVYHRQVELQRRLSDKSLTLKWEVFRDKLRPGQEEEWKLIIRNPRELPVAAELLATMYDASLDKISKQQQHLQLYYNLPLPSVRWMDQYVGYNYFYVDFPYSAVKVPARAYDRFNIPHFSIFEMDMLPRYTGGVNGLGSRTFATTAKPNRKVSAPQHGELQESVVVGVMDGANVKTESFSAELLDEGGDDLRTNFSETAFFYPQLLTNEQGEVAFSFTMPQSLTRWNFRGYAHTKGMLTGMIEAEATTSKEFMIAPNLPRFVRVGDQTQVAATITNLTGKQVSGTTTLVLFDPLTDKVIERKKLPFVVEAGKITVVNFGFEVGEKYEMLGCRMVADGGTFSDGEQQLIPVLSDKVNLTTSVPLLVNGKEKRTFELGELFNNHSTSATHKRLTVEFTNNPAWLAVLALPSLSQSKQDNAVEWAAMYYANTLASYIMNSQPRIRAVFESWKQQGGTKESFLSNLQKNPELKNILLSESPWVMQAQTEEQQQERIGTLFDLNNIRNNNLSALTKLSELQLPDGSWAWYKGMSGSTYITTFIVEAQARLVKLTGMPLSEHAQVMQQAAFTYLHKQALIEYKEMRKKVSGGSKIVGVSNAVLNYLYLIALSNEEVPQANRTARDFYIAQLPAMISTMSVGDKAMAAIILKSDGKDEQADAFMASLKEHLVCTPNQGASFARPQGGSRWAESAIPVHVAVMEAFDAVAHDSVVVEEMKTWLLRQKQTEQWNSPVATVNAVYGLLCTGTNLLDSSNDVRLTLGNQVLETTTPKQGETVGLGYFKETFTTPKMVNASRITVEKQETGIAWGAVYGEYLEQIDQVEQQGKELAVTKQLYIERLVNNVPQLEPLIKGKALSVGDKVVSRLTIRLDRAMSFVQLKDQYAACLEPVSSLSGYRWSNGLGYYIDVKDASTSFFFESLSKGTFVLESSFRVSRSGTYQGGLATLECAYAPEFRAHSRSEKIVVN